MVVTNRHPVFINTVEYLNNYSSYWFGVEKKKTFVKFIDWAFSWWCSGQWGQMCDFMPHGQKELACELHSLIMIMLDPELASNKNNLIDMLIYWTKLSRITSFLFYFHDPLAFIQVFSVWDNIWKWECLGVFHSSLSWNPFFFKSSESLCQWHIKPFKQCCRRNTSCRVKCISCALAAWDKWIWEQRKLKHIFEF